MFLTAEAAKSPNKVIYTVYRHVPSKPGELRQWAYHSSSLLSEETAQASVKKFVCELVDFFIYFIFGISITFSDTIIPNVFKNTKMDTQDCCLHCMHGSLNVRSMLQSHKIFYAARVFVMHTLSA